MENQKIQYLQELDRDLYYEEGHARKYQGTAQKILDNMSRDQTGKISSKCKWVYDKLKSNYASWNKLPPKERIPAIRQNLQSLLTELKKNHPENG